MQNQNIMKKVVAVAPYEVEERPKFKIYPYKAWQAIGGNVTASHYPNRIFHGLVYRIKLPKIKENKRIAQLRFVQPVSINFDTFPEYMTNEIIPFVWDCWPGVFDMTCLWFMRYNVKTAVFTSSQTAELMKKRFPQMKILYVPEGIDVSVYRAGKCLKERNIDALEYGRKIDKVIDIKPSTQYSYYNLRGEKKGKLTHSQDQLVNILADSKIVFAFPQSMTNPEIAGNIETLTQRYWEGMLSRAVLIGHAPKELVDLIGYNPVIEINLNDPDKQIIDILKHIEDFQPLVDRNYATALKFGDWKYSMSIVQDWLISIGYKISNNDS